MFVMLSSGPGGGKSTLLLELARRGFAPIMLPRDPVEAQTDFVLPALR